MTEANNADCKLPKKCIPFLFCQVDLREIDSKVQV